MIKAILKRYIPNPIKTILKRSILKKTFRYNYKYDLYKFLEFSRSYKIESESKLIGAIIATYHVIEKGLTMPETRLGFGKEKILLLCDLVNKYISSYTLNNEQVEHAIQVILEYKYFHENNNYNLSPAIEKGINSIVVTQPTIQPSCQRKYNRDLYFKDLNASFNAFSRSRASVRNYSEISIPEEDLFRSFELAKTAPSACNRQSIRPYVISNKSQIQEILEIQAGSRGFGHLTNKLIIITAELGVYAGVAERNLAYVDGGMYAMNLLYSLHFNKIAACILNCSLNVQREKALRKVCNVKESEIFIAMITCGIPPEDFKVALSKRLKVEETVTYL